MTAYYKEIQKFTQSWLWALIAVTVVPTLAVVTYGFISQLLMGAPWGEEPMSDSGLAIFTVLIWTIMGGIILIVLFAELQLEIHDSAIYYRFTVLSHKLRRIAMEDLESWEVRRFGLFEFGGYGAHFGLEKTTALIVRGKTGLELKLKKGKTIMIGTQNPEEVKKVMQNEWDRFTQRKIDG